MRRGYGLAELSFHVDEGAWRCSGINVQAPRLSWGDVSTVRVPLWNDHGEFAPRVKCNELAANHHQFGLCIETGQRRGDHEHSQVPGHRIRL